MSEAIGETQWLHSTRAPFKVVVTKSGVSGSGHFRLSEAEGVLVYTRSRGLARVVGSLTVSVKGPAGAAKSTEAAIVITPCDLPAWPSDIAELRKAPHTAEVTSSLYLNQQTQSLQFHEAINHQLKPEPHLARHPGIVWAWAVTGGASTDKVVLEISGELELGGIDYVSPW
jgi:hypothetical protein